MLERLFTSKARVRILKLLIFDADAKHHIRDIARREGISAPYVKKELGNLAALNLVNMEKKGNLLLFSINRSAPIFEDLKRIFLKTDALGEYLAGVLNDKIRYALIYGSFAKGEERKTSDIDLLLVGPADRTQIAEKIYDTEKALGREINYILWSEPEFEKLARKKHALIHQIVSNPVIMLRGDENEFRETVRRWMDKTD